MIYILIDYSFTKNMEYIEAKLGLKSWFLTYLFARGPGGAETTLILSSVISEPDALWGPPRRSLPEVRSDLNEFPRRSTPTGNEPALSIAVRESTSLCSLPRCLPAAN